MTMSVFDGLVNRCNQVCISLIYKQDVPREHKADAMTQVWVNVTEEWMSQKNGCHAARLV